MKKTMTFLLSTMMLTAVLTSCSSEEAPAETPSSTPAASAPAASGSDSGSSTPASNNISMGGSTSVEEIISAMMAQYQQDTGVTLTYAGTGSSGGVSGVLENTIDLGLASRALKSSEEESGAVSYTFAYDGIAVIINNDNAVTEISSEDLASIYTGEISNWSELGGTDAPIVVIGRDPASGTRGAFEEILGISDETMHASEAEATGVVVSSVSGNPNAIGYVSLSAVGTDVQAVSVDGVEPSEDTIKDNSYPIQRPFIFVTGAEVDPVTEAFVEWATSSEVASIVESKGCVAP